MSAAASPSSCCMARSRPGVKTKRCRCISRSPTRPTTRRVFAWWRPRLKPWLQLAVLGAANHDAAVQRRQVRLVFQIADMPRWQGGTALQGLHEGRLLFHRNGLVARPRQGAAGALVLGALPNGFKITAPCRVAGPRMPLKLVFGFTHTPVNAINQDAKSLV